MYTNLEVAEVGMGRLAGLLSAGSWLGTITSCVDIFD